MDSLTNSAHRQKSFYTTLAAICLVVAFGLGIYIYIYSYIYIYVCLFCLVFAFVVVFVIVFLYLLSAAAICVEFKLRSRRVDGCSVSQLAVAGQSKSNIRMRRNSAKPAVHADPKRYLKNIKKIQIKYKIKLIQV